MQTQPLRISVALASDNHYARYLATAIASILQNANPNDELDFYVVDEGISETNKKRIAALGRIKPFNISYLKVNKELFANMPMLQGAGHASLVTYYRFMLAELLPQLDKVLFLDCDTLALQSLRALWEVDIGENYIAATADQADFMPLHKKKMGMKPESLYFNAGMMLCNLKMWREKNASKMLFEARKKLDEIKVMDFGDQDALNLAFEGKVKETPWIYNSNQQYWNEQAKAKAHQNELVVAHFITLHKPDSAYCEHPYRHLWHKYFRLSGFPGGTWNYLNQIVVANTPHIFIYRGGYHESSLSFLKINLVRVWHSEVFRLRLLGLTVAQAYRKGGRLRAKLLGIPII